LHLSASTTQFKSREEKKSNFNISEQGKNQD